MSSQEADLGHASVAAILSHQSESGAFAASPDFSQYGYCWLRDGSFTAYALDRANEHHASAAYHDWVESALTGIAGTIDAAIEKRLANKTIEPGDLPPARFALDGSPVADDWPNYQIDGYGTWLWSLDEHLRLASERALPERLLASVERAARYLSVFALDPCFDVWEMNGTETHTSTLASVFGGLAAASRLLADSRYGARAEEVRARVVTAAQAAGRFAKSDHNDEIEASTLWLSQPFGLVSPSDPLLAHNVREIEEKLHFDGDGIRRFPSDTYFGGGAWPVLTASLGWHHVAVGNRDRARSCLEWIERHFDPDGRLGEQFGGEELDRAMYDEWVERWGPPAKQLVWSHAMHVVLRAELEVTG